MVTFLGAFSHKAFGGKETENILLEYGDLDLDEYFNDKSPPVFPTEILGFWKLLFEIGNAIKGVHNVKFGEGEFTKDYYG